jgi:hypothetical protein
MVDSSSFLECEHFACASGDGFSLRDLIHLDLAGVGDRSVVGAEPGDALLVEVLPIDLDDYGFALT